MSSDVIDGPLPESRTPLVVRTDFGDEPGWLALADEIGDEIQASADLVTFFADTAYRGATAGRLLGLVPNGARRQPVLMVADEVTFSSAEHQLLVIDLLDEPGRTFRATAEAVSTVVNNLVIANQSFDDYLNMVDEAGVYRLSERFRQAMAEMRAAMVLRPAGSPQARIAGPPRMATRGQRTTPVKRATATKVGRPMTRAVPSRPAGETTQTPGDITPTSGEAIPTSGGTTPTPSEPSPIPGGITPTSGGTTPTPGEAVAESGEAPTGSGDDTSE